LVNKLRSVSILIDNKQKNVRRVLTEGKLHDAGTRLQHTPRKSLKRLTQETGVSKFNARRATKLLNLRPYTFTPCSRRIKATGLISAVAFYSLSSKVSSILN
jgi:hypothetical protein